MATTSKWAAAQATHARVQRCRDLLKTIGEALEGYAERAAKGPGFCNWGHAGDVAGAREQLQRLADSLHCETGAAVDEADACPGCGERHSDMLVWDEEGETVRCFNCGRTYKIGRAHV